MTLRKRILNYFIKTLNGMALGLFSTLIIGVIINQIGRLTGIVELQDLAAILSGFMGIGIGLGVAFSLELKGLRLLTGAMAGGIATLTLNGGVFGPPGDPVVAYLTTIAAIEVLRFVLRKPTPVDIVLIPLVSSLVALLVVTIIGQPIATTMELFGNFIRYATTIQPFFMGIIIAVLMGMALTSPISSAAIAFSITLGGIAGGAAVVGGAVQMIGFAVMSRKDNTIGEVISIAIGTSMLQFKNILRKPIIWVPTIVVSAILGPISTLFFRIETDVSGAGMGTSGFVGQIATFDAMSYSSSVIISVILLHFVFPIILVFLIDVWFRKKGLIELGDLTLKAE